MNLPINPETKVGALLEAYPQAEEILIAASPAFARLRNPVLRRTVAKVATLEQAARIGAVEVRELVRKLREATGQPGFDPPACHSASGLIPAAGPEWLRNAPVFVDVDAGAMLERGVHPVGTVREAAAKLPAGETIRLSSPFRPEPLIEMMRRAGMDVHSEEVAPGHHQTWFGRPVRNAT